jgi:hypothetical protein
MLRVILYENLVPTVTHAKIMAYRKKYVLGMAILTTFISPKSKNAHKKQAAIIFCASEGPANSHRL